MREEVDNVQWHVQAEGVEDSLVSMVPHFVAPFDNAKDDEMSDTPLKNRRRPKWLHRVSYMWWQAIPLTRDEEERCDYVNDIKMHVGTMRS
jgi:hypothetical protein